MASIRSLKKQISTLADNLATATLLSKAELTESDIQTVNSILGEIYNFEDEFRNRAHHYDAKANPKLVKKYFNKLFNDLEEQAIAIAEKVKTLND